MQKGDAGLIAERLVELTDGKVEKPGIEKILPHREPFLFLDRVVEIEKLKRAVGIWRVREDAFFFKGHFPGNPIMPGLLIVEAMAQAAGILMLNNEEYLKKPAYFIGVDGVKFRKPVIPGDELRMEITMTKLRSRMCFLHSIAAVNGETVAEADIIFGFGSPG